MLPEGGGRTKRPPGAPPPVDVGDAVAVSSSWRTMFRVQLPRQRRRRSWSTAKSCFGDCRASKQFASAQSGRFQPVSLARSSSSGPPIRIKNLTGAPAGWFAVRPAP